LDAGSASSSWAAGTWWFSEKMLPWLQREYLETAFKDYRPLLEHEDDLPMISTTSALKVLERDEGPALDDRTGAW